MIVCYGMITLFSFFLIPFAYFYYEEYDEDESVKDRIFVCAQIYFILCGDIGVDAYFWFILETIYQSTQDRFGLV